jgi:hypothetical protein
MEIFLIVLAAIAGTGVAFFLFVIEPSTIMILATLGKRSDVQVSLVRWCWPKGDFSILHPAMLRKS